MKRFIAEADRTQITLLPESLDDYIDETNPVRAIEAFIAHLDLAELGFDVVPEATGRPGYHPSALLRLFIYGYLNRVASSRGLEREAGRNLEVIWLLGRLVPDDKVIADFRKDNGLAIRKVCVRFVELCRQMGLLATACVAIDGSKFKIAIRTSRATRSTVGALSSKRACCAICGSWRRPTGRSRRKLWRSRRRTSKRSLPSSRRRWESSTPMSGSCWLLQMRRSRSPIPTAAPWRRAGAGPVLSATTYRWPSTRRPKGRHQLRARSRG
jgi:transposase